MLRNGLHRFLIRSSILSIGNLLGEQNAKRAAVAANTSIIMALALAGVSRCRRYTFYIIISLRTYFISVQQALCF